MCLIRIAFVVSAPIALARKLHRQLPTSVPSVSLIESGRYGGRVRNIRVSQVIPRHITTINIKY